MADEVSPFTIKELSGQKRTVVLVGRGLPYRPFSLSTKQRVVMTWNPGNPEATATVLGAQEAPTTIGGMWKDKYIDTTGESVLANVRQGDQAPPNPTSLTQSQPPITSNNEPVSTVRAAVALFDSICREGQLLEVTWFTEKRHGFLIQFDKRWENTHDAEWSCDFDWTGRGEPVGSVAFVAGTQPSAVFDALNAANQTLDDVNNGILGLNINFTTNITVFISGIQSNILDLQNSISNLVDKVLSPVRAIRGMIATISGIEEESKLMLSFLGSSTAESFSIPDGGSIDGLSQSERLSMELFRQELKAWAEFMKRTAVQQRVDLSIQIEGELAGEHIGKTGEDLRDVSRIFYNTPYEWRRIMLFNNLTTAELTAGQLVLVPKINPDDTEAT